MDPETKTYPIVDERERRIMWCPRKTTYYHSEAQFRSALVARQRSSLASPHFIRDCIELTGMHDGKTYTSKRALRQSYRDHGLIEIGDQGHAQARKRTSHTRKDSAALDDALRTAVQKAGL